MTKIETELHGIAERLQRDLDAFRVQFGVSSFDIATDCDNGVMNVLIKALASASTDAHA